eukprot:6179656-Pleurochrysis_carterae.AAC.3
MKNATSCHFVQQGSLVHPRGKKLRAAPGDLWEGNSVRRRVVRGKIQRKALIALNARHRAARLLGQCEAPIARVECVTVYSFAAPAGQFAVGGTAVHASVALSISGNLVSLPAARPDSLLSCKAAGNLYEDICNSLLSDEVIVSQDAEWLHSCSRQLALGCMMSAGACSVFSEALFASAEAF